MNSTALPHPTHAWVPYRGAQQICSSCGAFPNTPAGAAPCLEPGPEELPARTDITKEEAARRQLETAIALFFCENDEISIHVLASSAAQILTDVCKTKNIRSWHDMFMERVRPEYEKFAIYKIKEPYNYFKHADRDTFDTLTRFHPGVNASLLFACCLDYRNAFGDLPSVPLVFFWWTVAVNPEMMPEENPLRPQFLNAFAGLDGRPEAEQRRAGRDLLHAYLLSRDEPLPLRGWQSR
jgi:hypothetical protein